jgi:hypothetical protein
MVKQASAAYFQTIRVPGLGPFLTGVTGVGTAATTLDLFISTLLGVLTIIGGIAFLIFFVLGALAWISSRGEREQLAKAQRYMSNALIGLIIIILAWAITGILGELLGFQILNLPTLIDSL